MNECHHVLDKSDDSLPKCYRLFQKSNNRDAEKISCTVFLIYMASLTVLSGHRVARWVSPKYRTLAVTQNIELFIHALSGITIVFIPDKEPKYRIVR